MLRRLICSMTSPKYQVEAGYDPEDDTEIKDVKVKIPDSENPQEAEAPVLHLELVGFIDEDTVVDFLKFSRQAALFPDAPAIIYFNCIGGDLTTAIALGEIVAQIPNPTIGVNLGKVFSGTLLPFLSCDTKLAMPHALMLFHDVSINTGEVQGAKDLEALSIHNNNMTKQWRSALRKLMKDTSKLDEWLQTETYLNTEQALTFKLIDNITTEIA